MSISECWVSSVCEQATIHHVARMQKPGFESDLWHLYCMSSPQFPVHLYLLSTKKCENPKK